MMAHILGHFYSGDNPVIVRILSVSHISSTDSGLTWNNQLKIKPVCFPLFWSSKPRVHHNANGSISEHNG